MSLPIPSAAKRVDYIQSLRAVAATIVAVSHIAKEELQRNVPDRYGILSSLMSLQFGVDIFFVISGFIMYWVTFGKPKGSGEAASFIKKRIIRVVPLYWIFTILFLLPVFFAPHVLHHPGISTIYIVASFLFIPWPKPDYGAVEPVLGLGWTLNYEMLFYLIFALLLALRVNRIILALAAIFVAAIVVGWFVPFGATQLWYWTRSIILEFLFGAGIAALVRAGRASVPPIIGWAAIVAGIVIWQAAFALWPVAEPTFNVRGLSWGVAAALIVGGVALSPAVSATFEFGGPKGIVQRVGDASYSLYLSHMFVVRIATFAIGGLAAWAYVPLTVALCIAASLLLCWGIEKPLIRAGLRLSRAAAPQGRT